MPSLRPGDRVHLLGVGGAGMSGLARVLAGLGLLVTGTDRATSPVLAALAAEGIDVRAGHDAAALPANVALVVRSPAVPEDNPEVVAAHAAGVPVVKRADLLGALLDSRIGLAIAGTHGKTTSSGLLAVVLDSAGWDPTFFIGGDVPDLGTNARAGRGDHVVVEADEYDFTFLSGHPVVAVILNIEHDHPDIYPDLAAVTDAFRAFVANVRPEGRVIAHLGTQAVRTAVAGASVPVEGYTVEGELEDGAAAAPGAMWRATAVVATPDGQRFAVRRGDTDLGTFGIRLAGRHNVGNALAVIAAAAAAGVPIDVVRSALARYGGTGRRFEVLGRVGQVHVVDDYAHHPTEIRATIAAARERFGGRIWAIAQPHTFSRVAALAESFGTALATADRVVVTPVYAAREAPVPGVDATLIVGRVPGAVTADNLAAAVDLVVAEAEAGDAILFMGAGDITDASRQCWRRLVEGRAADLLAAARGADLAGDVLVDPTLAPHTSLRVGGAATLLVRVRSLRDLVAWRRLAMTFDLPARVLGRGTNVLAADEGFDGLVVLNRCERWRLETSAGAETAIVVAEGGVTLAALAHQLARDGWAGIEAGAGIPGSVGGAVVTNAGARGWSMADSVQWVEVLEADGAEQRHDVAELGLAYRTSALKGHSDRTVLRVAMAVRRDEPVAIRERIARDVDRRRATQPTVPSAGSMFKNPPGDYAGRLIEQAGLKGHVAGGAEISAVHANFFVNRGGATAADVWQLVAMARSGVRSRFGVNLELEIEPLGGRDVVA